MAASYCEADFQRASVRIRFFEMEREAIIVNVNRVARTETSRSIAARSIQESLANRCDGSTPWRPQVEH